MISRFEKHPVITLTLVTLVLLIVCVIAAEIILRLTVKYDIGYYTAVKKEGVYEYPYGTIHINSLGLPDQEFDLSSPKPRIGYFGDSIFMGVGAGDRYRITDLLEKQKPAYDHWTIAMMGEGLREKDLLSFVDRYKINHVVYGFNLNDIVPPYDASGYFVSTENQTKTELFLQYWILRAHLYTDWLRGKSYLYTILRNGIKNMLGSSGYSPNGLRSIELFPNRNKDMIKQVAERFNALEEDLSRRGISLCLMIFPYEMQISQAAAQTYRDHGLKWEEGFEDGSTQDLFLEYLKISHVYDARNAFQDADRGAPAGTYFVYNRGDKIDYNHPNRKGHKLIADDFTARNPCGIWK